jgi:pimeloyl-ACP methyl ester carboxylesterase
MSAITVDDELVHYEVLGRGKPVILVHGWLGSWRYWVPTMQQLAMKYRCYALDLWGFGDSGKDPTRYTFDKQIDLLDRFIERMGIPKVVLVGHGLGASIVARFAAKSDTAEKVHRMLLVCPPLIDFAPSEGYRALTTNTAVTVARRGDLPMSIAEAQAQYLAQQDAKREAQTPTPDKRQSQQVRIHPATALKEVFDGQPLDGLLLKATTSDSPDFEKLRREVSKTDHRAVMASINAFEKVNTFRDLLGTRCPVFVLLGENDSFLPKPEEALMRQLDAQNNLKLLVMSETQHFPMLEDKAQFSRLIKDFLENPDLSQLEFKEEWRRRKR